MSRHDPLVPLRHMLDHAREAAGMVQGKTRADLDANRQLNIHGYDEVDFDILWKIATESLPPLIQALERIVAGSDAQKGS